MYSNKNLLNLTQIMRRNPNATAIIRGSDDYSAIRGYIRFYQTKSGVLVVSEITGLPQSDEACGNRIFGFHIHNGKSCSGNEQDPFADAMTHYDPNGCPHPHHAGDMPPLFGAGGNAFSAFLTSSFTIDEIIGLTVIIHSKPDDFTTQPSGNAGTKIACGVII